LIVLKLVVIAGKRQLCTLECASTNKMARIMELRVVIMLAAWDLPNF